MASSAVLFDVSSSMASRTSGDSETEAVFLTALEMSTATWSSKGTPGAMCTLLHSTVVDDVAEHPAGSLDAAVLMVPPVDLTRMSASTGVAPSFVATIVYTTVPGAGATGSGASVTVMARSTTAVAAPAAVIGDAVTVAATAIEASATASLFSRAAYLVVAPCVVGPRRPSGRRSEGSARWSDRTICGARAS